MCHGQPHLESLSVLMDLTCHAIDMAPIRLRPICVGTAPQKAPARFAAPRPRSSLVATTWYPAWKQKSAKRQQKSNSICHSNPMPDVNQMILNVHIQRANCRLQTPSLPAPSMRTEAPLRFDSDQCQLSHQHQLVWFGLEVLCRGLHNGQCLLCLVSMHKN